MKPRRFILGNDNPRWEAVRDRCIEFIQSLNGDTKVDITITKHDDPKTLQQNAYYWAAYVKPLSDHFGYTKQEMHEVLLAECFGQHKVGELILPNKRTGPMKKKEMMEYLDWLPRFAAEHGVVLALPE